MISVDLNQETILRLLTDDRRLKGFNDSSDYEDTPILVQHKSNNLNNRSDQVCLS